MQTHAILQEEISDMGDVRQLVNKLYMALNIDQHQVMKERDIVSQIEELKAQLAPLEKVGNVFVYIFSIVHRNGKFAGFDIAYFDSWWLFFFFFMCFVSSIRL